MARNIKEEENGGEFGEGIIEVTLPEDGGFVNRVFDLRRNITKVKRVITYQEPFNQEETKLLVEMGRKKGVLPGPIDVDMFRHPNLYFWEGRWASILGLSAIKERLTPDSPHQQHFAEAIGTDWPEAYFTDKKPPIGMYCKLFEPPTSRVYLPTVKDMAPILMGDDWSKVSFGDKFDYWSKPNPQTAVNFADTHDVYALKSPAGVVLDESWMDFEGKLGKDGWENFLATWHTGKLEGNHTTEQKYLCYLMAKGAYKLAQDNSWVSMTDFSIKYRTELSDWLKGYMEDLFGNTQTVVLAASTPK